PIGPGESVSLALFADESRPAQSRILRTFGIGAKLTEQNADIIMPLRPLGNRSKIADDFCLLFSRPIPGCPHPCIRTIHPLRALMCKLERLVRKERRDHMRIVRDIERSNPAVIIPLRRTDHHIRVGFVSRTICKASSAYSFHKD